MGAVTGGGGPAVLISGVNREGVITNGGSRNMKLGRVLATYMAMQSCPETCQFHPENLHGAPKKNRASGLICYAIKGGMTLNSYPLNRAGHGQTPQQLAEEEAAGIDRIRLPRGFPMRLHDVGDAPTNAAARTISAAADRYRERGGGPVWAYTHAWRQVDRRWWGGVSILASCDLPQDIALAHERGYATALVVPDFGWRGTGRFTGRMEAMEPNASRYTLDGHALLPCPEQTGRAANCASCRLCWDAPRLLRDRLTIAFQEH